MSRRWKIFAIVGVLSLLADQLTKIWARDSLVRSETVPFVGNVWDWRLSENPGSAFGLFNATSGARVFLSVIGIVAVVAILWMVKKARDDQTRLAWALGLVIGGAIGNLIDRISFGVVTDFIVWRYDTHEWPTFNVADVTLVVGVLLLFLDMILETRREKQMAKPEPAPAAPANTAKNRPKSKSKKKK